MILSLLGINQKNIVKDVKTTFGTALSNINLGQVAKKNMQSFTLKDWDVWNSGELKDRTIAKYTQQLNGLSAVEAKAVLSTTQLTKAQQEQVLSAHSLALSNGNLATTEMMISKEQQSRLITSGLVSKADLEQAVSMGILTLEKDGNLIVTKNLTQAEIERQLVESGMTPIAAKNIAMLKMERGEKVKNLGVTNLLTKATTALNVAWLTNPIGVITAVAGAVALVTVGIVAYNNSVDGLIKKNKKLIESNHKLYDSLIEEKDNNTNNAKELKELLSSFYFVLCNINSFYIIKKSIKCSFCIFL